jgi:hypothetical protein
MITTLELIDTINRRIDYANNAAADDILSPTHEAAMEWIKLRDTLIRERAALELALA